MEKTLIDQAFDVWINNYQKSSRSYNIETFYVFVKTILKDGHNINKHDGDWLTTKIQNSKKITKNDTDYFVELFFELKNFYHSQPLSKQRYL